MDIAHFGKVFIFSMSCEGCNYRKADVEPAEEGEPAKYTLDVDSDKDMNIKIIKAGDATVKIPYITTIEPGPAGEGYITNVEGLLNRVKAAVEAAGEAERNIKDAEGYALERINRAKGDANRFLMQWNEYNKAKDVTRRRLYLEAMSEVIPNLGVKYILDPEQSGLLPLLNLGQKEGEGKQ